MGRIAPYLGKSRRYATGLPKTLQLVATPKSNHRHIYAYNGKLFRSSIAR
jgi:hypothetical protein